MKGLRKRMISMFLVIVMCVSLFPANAFAWQGLTHINSADLILMDLQRSANENGGRAYIELPDSNGTSNYRVPIEFQEAMFEFPDAFRAGALGPDYYPDILTGQTYIHPYDEAKDMGSGEWIKLLCDSVNDLPKDSRERKEALAFTLGYMLHYCGDLFGHDFINTFAGGSFPSFSDIDIGDPQDTALNYVLSHMAEEAYMDELVNWDFYNENGYLDVAAPVEFVTDTMVLNGSINGGAAKIFEEYGSVPVQYKYLVNLRQSIYETANSWRENVNPVSIAVVAYLDRWIADLDDATYALVRAFDRIAARMVSEKNASVKTVVTEELKDGWFHDYGTYISPLPDIPIAISQWVSDLLMKFPFVKDINTWINNLILEMVMMISGLDEYEAYLSDAEKQLNSANNPFKPSEDNFAEFKEYMDRYADEQKQLDGKTKEQLIEGDDGDILDELLDSDLEAFYNTMAMFRLILVGPDSFSSYISDLTNQNQNVYQKGTAHVSASSLKLRITTANLVNAGTNDNIFAEVYKVSEENGIKTKTRLVRKLLDISLYDDFEAGKVDTYEVELPESVRIDEIEVSIVQEKVAGSVAAEWICENIEIIPVHTDKELIGSISVGGNCNMNSGKTWNLNFQRALKTRTQSSDSKEKQIVTNLKLQIKTGGKSFAGTDSDIYLDAFFIGDGGFVDWQSVLMDKPGYNDFENGCNDTYNVPVVKYDESTGETTGIPLDKLGFYIRNSGNDDWTMCGVWVTPMNGSLPLTDPICLLPEGQTKTLSKSLWLNILYGLYTVKNNDAPVTLSYETNVNGGLIDYVKSLDDGVQWLDSENFLWDNTEVRREVFFNNFKGFSPDIEMELEKNVVDMKDTEEFDMTLKFFGMWNGIHVERRNEVAGLDDMPPVEGVVDVRFIQLDPEEEAPAHTVEYLGQILTKDTADTEKVESELIIENIKGSDFDGHPGWYDVEVVYKDDRMSPQYADKMEIFRAALLVSEKVDDGSDRGIILIPIPPIIPIPPAVPPAVPPVIPPIIPPLPPSSGGESVPGDNDSNSKIVIIQVKPEEGGKVSGTGIIMGKSYMDGEGNFYISPQDVIDAIKGKGTYGVGFFNNGDTVKVKASANEDDDYEFSKWKNGWNNKELSDEKEFEFKTDDADIQPAGIVSTLTGGLISDCIYLVAEFSTEKEDEEFKVTVTADPKKGGKVSGAGSYEENEEATVTAKANSGYTFVGWYDENNEPIKDEEGNPITDESYSFEVTEDVDLIAKFQKDSDKYFNLEYQIHASEIGGFRPKRVEMLIEYDKSKTYEVIEQMKTDNGYEGQDTLLNANNVENSYSVLKYKEDGITPYNYKISLYEYVAYNGAEKTAFDAEDAPFTVTYNGTTKYDGDSGQTKMLTATLKPKEYPITFDLNMDAVNPENVKGMDDYYVDADPEDDKPGKFVTEYKWSHGKDISGIIPEIDGYIFQGWYEDPECKGDPVTAIGAEKHEEITLYAKWDDSTASKYTITVETENCTSNPNETMISVTEGNNQTISFTPASGYTFDTVTVDGKYTVLTYNEETAEFEYTFSNVDKDHTIRVVCAEDEYGNGDSGDGIPDKYQALVTYKVEEGTWDTDGKDAADKKYYFTLKEKKLDNNGKWTGEWINAEPVPTLGGTIPDVTTATPTNGGSGHWKGIEPNDTTKVTGDAVYTYTFLAPADVTFTFRFDANGGKWITDNTVVDGYTLNAQKTVAEKTDYKANDLVASITAPQCEGNTFLGWYDSTGAQWDATEPITADTIVYAKWQKQVTFTFDANGGTWGDVTTVDGYSIDRENSDHEKASRDYTSGQKVDEITIPQREGYAFQGWYTNINSKASQWTSAETVTMDKTVYAKWQSVDGPIVTFTFDANGGAWSNDAANIDEYYVYVDETDADHVKAVRAYPFNGKVIKIGDPEREGYKFQGWYIDINGEKTQWTETKPITEHTTVYAEWQEQVTFTFDANGGTWSGNAAGDYTVDTTGSTITASKVYPVNGEVVKIGNPERKGYTFQGWYADINDEGTQWTETKSITADTTVYAKWTADSTQKLTITFDANGGAWNNDVAGYTLDDEKTVATKGSYVVGDTAEQISELPVWNANEFLGWYENQDGTGKQWWGSGSGTETITADTTVYAKWNCGYTVQYIDVTTNNVLYSESAKVLKGTSVKVTAPEKYTVGTDIYTLCDKDGDLATDAIMKTFTVDGTSQVITFYYKDTPLKFTFNANGGAWSDNVNGYTLNGEKTVAQKDSYTVGATVAQIYELPVKNDHRFVGWYENPDGTGKHWWGSNSDETITADTTVYAKWGEESSYIVEHVYMDIENTITAETMMLYDAVKGTSETVTPALEMDYNGRAYTLCDVNGIVVTKPSAQTITVDGISRLRFYYKLAPATLTFDANGGTWGDVTTVGGYSVDKENSDHVKASKDYTPGNKADRIEDPKREGYTFLGWYDITNKQWWEDGTDPIITANTTLYADWKKVESDGTDLTFTFDANGGAWNGAVDDYIMSEYWDSKPTVASKIYKEDNVVEKIGTIPERAGHEFLGWFDSNGTQWWQMEGATETISKSTTVYARWSELPYTVQYVDFDNAENVLFRETRTAGGSASVSVTVPKTYETANGLLYQLCDETGNAVTDPISKTITVGKDAGVTFYYKLPKYMVTADVNPGGAGTVAGTGEYAAGARATVTATANPGYKFTCWKDAAGNVIVDDNNKPVTSASYRFTVERNVMLVAEFDAVAYTVTTDVNPNGAGTVTGGGTFHYGEEATVTATANEGFAFEKWTKNGEQVSTNATYSFPVTEDVELVAEFTTTTAEVYTVKVSAAPKDGGKVTGGGNYVAGSTATVTAAANAGYVFAGWKDTVGNPIFDINGDEVKSAVYSFTVTNDVELVAKFNPVGYTVTTDASPKNGGKVTGHGYYMAGTTATVAATPAEGYVFAGWKDAAGNPVVDNNGDPVTSAVYSFEVTEDVKLVAQFMAVTRNYTVAVSANPSDAGTVAGGGTYAKGTTATVTATADTGYVFVCWTEAGTEVSTDAAYSFEVTGNRTLVATFRAVDAVNDYTVNASVSPAGSGVVTGSGTYAEGTRATVTATANTDYVFVGWTKGGTVVSTKAIYSFEVTEDVELVAEFESITPATPIYNVRATANPRHGGTVTGSGTYEEGTTVTVTATPAEGYVFTGWTEADTEVSTDAAYSFVVTEDVELEANFEEADNTLSYTITVSADPEDGGEATGGGTYGEGTTATVTATPAEGYAFIGWKEGSDVVSTSEDYSFTVTDNRTLVAEFKEKAVTTFYSVSVSADPEDGGDVTGGGTYAADTTATVIATPEEGYVFVGWTEAGSVVSTKATYRFTVTGDRDLEAKFEAERQIYTVTATESPDGAGTVTGSGIYAAGTTATVTATPADDYVFVGWKEGNNTVSTATSYSFKVNGNRNLVAEFTDEDVTGNTYEVIATAKPANGGTVIGSGVYLENATATVKATAKPGYEFTVWKDADDNVIVDDDYDPITSETYSFTVTNDVELVAEFNAVEYTVTADVSSDSPVGSGTVTGGGTFHYGEETTVTAAENEGFKFVKWKTNNGKQVSTDPEYEFKVTENIALFAEFAPAAAETYTVEASASPKNGGVVTGGGDYAAGTTATVKATANTGYVFAGWYQKDENGRLTVITAVDEDYSFTVTEDVKLVAKFNPVNYTVTAMVSTDSPVDSGTVSGSGTYAHGKTATVTATAKEGFTFVRWTQNGGAVSADASYSFKVTEDVTMVAEFRQAVAGDHTVEVDVYPSNSGTAAGGGTYADGTTATVSAKANEGYAFVGWWTESGALVSTDVNYSFAATKDVKLIAVFAEDQGTEEPDTTCEVTVIALPAEGGTTKGGGTYAKGASAIVTAAANSGYRFAGWITAGIENIRTKSYNFTVINDVELVAVFEKLYQVTATAYPAYAGTVEGSGEYAEGKTATVTATANPGYRFLRWTEDGNTVSTDETFSFTVTKDMELVAVFAEEQSVEVCDVTVIVLPAEGGTATGGGTYEKGEYVTVTATANEGYNFAGWIIAGVQNITTNSYSFTVTEDVELVAMFEKTQSPGSGGSDRPNKKEDTETPTDDPIHNDTEENGNVPVPSAFSLDHEAYIVGDDDGRLHPERFINRAEVASIFFRLLDDDVRAKYLTHTSTFADVKDGMWYTTAVATMAKMGVISGYPDGTFNPKGNITRAEFAAIAARFDENGNTTTASFADMFDHWAVKEVSIAANNRWVKGYPDGSFRPNAKITRAEAISLINRVLQRVPGDVNDLYPGMRIWTDNVNKSMWYYLAVQEATNSHTYDRKADGHEYWTGLLNTRDWAATAAGN